MTRSRPSWWHVTGISCCSARPFNANTVLLWGSPGPRSGRGRALACFFAIRRRRDGAPVVQADLTAHKERAELERILRRSTNR